MTTDTDTLRYEISDFAYGTWRILDSPNPLNTDELAERFRKCLELGIDTIDTAEIYGDYQVEEAVGKALGSDTTLREGLKVVTKAGINVPSKEKAQASIPQYDATADNIVYCVEKSLRLLEVDAIDLFLVHRPDWLTRPDDTAKGLQRILDEGKAKAVGVSNYTIYQFETLDRLMDGKLATNQVEFSPLCMNPLYDGTFDQCLQKKIRPMAWSALGGGTLFSEREGPAERLRDKIAELSPKYGDAPIDAMVYAWILAVPANPTVILGTNKLERIVSGAKGGDVRMERDDWYAIWEAAKGESVP